MKKFALLMLFAYTSAVIYAQNSGAYLIPRQIFIGDPAVLILPLPGSERDTTDIILTAPNFPYHANIDFHRIILERRTGGSRLMIEFTAFVPGTLEFPAIEIGGDRFAGLTVTVNSLIDSRSSVVLSGPASSLAMPGTALMLYGTMAILIIFILIVIWFIVKGRVFFQKLKDKWKHWRLFVSMRIMEKLLHRSVLRGVDKRIILDKLSDELRTFLSFLTGNNCRAMTAAEFEKLPLYFLKTQDINPSFLGNFFRSCDELRFSGVDISSDDILRLLADLRIFLNALENAKKKKNAKTGDAS